MFNPTRYLLALLLLWSGCQNAQSPQLVADYLIRYQEANEALRLQAKFKQKEGAAFAEYQPSTGVQALGHAFSYKNRQGYGDNVYVLDRRQPWAGSYDIQFRMPDGQLAQQAIAFSPLQRLRLSSDTISLAQGFTLTWDGQPLQEQQKLQLLFSATDLPDLPMIKVGSTGGNSLIIRAEQLARLQPGRTYTLQLTHTHYQPLAPDAPTTGAYTVEYFYLPMQVVVVP